MPRVRVLNATERAEFDTAYIAEAGKWSEPRLTGDPKYENYGMCVWQTGEDRL
jgi:hypothetical protein